MSDKPRIAICVSGQTRHFNENPQYIDDLNSILELFDEFEYDLYGHTWADQEDPKQEVLDRFTAYESEDQRIIWDEIINLMYVDSSQTPAKYHQFFQIDDDWKHKKEFMDMLHGKSDQNYLKFCKERINGTIGQVWSAHRSFQLMIPHMKTKSYQAVVRLRWDLMIKNYHGEEFMSKQRQRFKDIIHDWYNNQHDFEHAHIKPDILCADDCIFELRQGPYANDQVFVVNFLSFLNSKILTTKPIKYLEDMIKYYSDGMAAYCLPSAHTLWMQWWLESEMKISPKLPNMFQANGRDVYKVNKDWNI